MYNANWESSNGGLFQSYLLHKWLKPDCHELQLTSSHFNRDGPADEWTTSLACPTPFKLTWKSAQGISNLKSPLEIDIFYYELPGTASLPLFGALLVKNKTGFLLQITRPKQHSYLSHPRGEKHSPSLSGLQNILNFLPDDVKDVYYILIVFAEARDEPEIPPYIPGIEGQHCRDEAEKKGKSLAFCAAKVLK